MEILEADLAQSKGKGVNPTYIYIRSIVKNNILRVRERVWNSTRFVPHQHLLVKLLQGIGLHRKMTLDELRYYVTDRMYSLANALGLTSSTSYGTTHTGVLFKNTQEVIIVTNEAFEPGERESLTPIRVLYHEETNLNYQFGNIDPNDGLAYISINVPMLAYQYIQWSEWVTAHNGDENIYNFVYKYPMFNALYSYMDISFFNRFFYPLVGRGIDPETPYRETSLSDIAHLMSNVMQTYRTMINGGHRSISHVLYYTPLLFADSVIDLTTPPKLVKTRQVQWALDYYRLPYILYGILSSRASGYRVDSGKLTTLKRELMALSYTNSLNRLPKQTGLHIIERYFNPLILLL